MKRLMIMVLAAVMGGQLCASLSDGLVCWYKFDGNAKDSSGNENNGVVYGATLTRDRFGNANGAYSFDGNDWIEVANSVSLQSVSKVMTLSAWVKISDVYSSQNPAATILCKKTDSTTPRQFGLTCHTLASKTPARICIDDALSPEGVSVTVEEGIEFNSWQSLLITYDGSVAAVYINGVFKGSRACECSMVENLQNLLIGKDPPGYTEYFRGCMDDIRIYNRALSAEEVKAVYDSERVTTYYVNGMTGSDENPGTSPEAAKKTIQAAIDVSVDGDTIFVAPGTYAPITTDNKRISIIGGGASNTVIDGGNATRCVAVSEDAYTIIATNTVIKGFSLIRGRSYNKNGGCVIGGTIVNCVVEGGAAINKSGAGAGGAILINCLVKDNSSTCGGGVAGSVAINCTFVGNNATVYGSSAHNSSLVNCIIGEGTHTEMSDWGDVPLCAAFGLKLISNYEQDPHFVDAANGDYRLAADSPCIDAGNNDYIVGTKDLDGLKRVINKKVDIGCYEYESYAWEGVEVARLSSVLHIGSGGGLFLNVTGSGTLTFKARGCWDGFYYNCDGTGGGYIRNENDFKDYSLTTNVGGPHTFLWATYAKGYIVPSAWGEVYDVRWNGRTIPYADEFPEEELVAHYEFNGDAKDSSGYGNDGVVHGATLTTDRFGNENGAYSFDGNDWISASASASFNSASNANSVCFWLNARSWSNRLLPVLAQQFVCYFERRSTEGERVADFYVGPGDLEDDFELGFDMPFDSWHLWTITSTGGKIVIYIDGQFAVSKEDCGYTFAKNKGLMIGRIGSYDNRYLIGLLDDIRIYNRALSAAEVKALYDSEKPLVQVWTVAFDARGGVASKDTMVVTNNTAIGELPTAERDGHKFLGWYSAVEGGTQVTPETIITNDVTFYAHWFDTSIGGVTGATNVLWRTGGDAPWATEETAEGWDVRSGAIGKSSETWVECVVTNGCRVAFEWKASCEPGEGDEMYDYLSFSIDGDPVAAICGETGWTNGVFGVSGDGEHILRWTYQKDNRTSAGEDCGWLGKVKVDPEVSVTFGDNGATSGEVPTIPTAYLGDTITIPGKGTLAKSCHAFGGWEYKETTYPEGAAFTLGTNTVEFAAVWNAKVLGLPTLLTPETPHVTTETISVSLGLPENAQGVRYTLDGTEPTAESEVYTGPIQISDRAVTVKAVAFADDWFDSACETWNLTRAPWSTEECLNAEAREFTFGGDADWVRDLDVTHDGEAAMRSGTIGNKQSSEIKMSVTGAGTVSFWCKVSSEYDPEDWEVYDGLAIAVDGKDVYPDLIGGEIDWTNITVSVSGEGEHVVSWRYEKDKTGSAGQDCAWLDEVMWQVNETIVPAVITGSDDLPISRSWIERDLVDRYGPGKTQEFRTKFGNDYDLAVLKPTGKTMNGSPASVWQDYVAGTDPTDTNSVFKSIIAIEDGLPIVTWDPDLGIQRTYKIWGRESLVNGSWECPTNSTHRFFKVTVEMPE